MILSLTLSIPSTKAYCETLFRLNECKNKTKQNQITRQEFVVVFFFIFFPSSVASIRRNEVKPNERTNEQRITIDRIKSEIVVMNRLNKIEFADSTLNRNMCYLVELAYLCTIHIRITHAHAHTHNAFAAYQTYVWWRWRCRRRRLRLIIYNICGRRQGDIDSKEYTMVQLRTVHCVEIDCVLFF